MGTTSARLCTVWVTARCGWNASCVMDSVFTTSGASVDQFMNLSSLDAAYGDVSDAFLGLCSEDSVCNSRFKKKGLKSTIQHLMTKFDKNPSSTCAKLLKPENMDQDAHDPPSSVLRFVLGTFSADVSLRTLIPPVVYRLLRCSQKDVGVPPHFYLRNDERDGASQSQSHGRCPQFNLLDGLIVFSEMWEAPTPSVSEMRARFEKATISGWKSYLQVQQYCAYSKEKSAVCSKLKLGNYKDNGIIYERDEYWNKATKIPDQASVLLMSSKMDLTTPSKYAEYLLKALDGDKKELITFKYTSMSNLISTTTMNEICGMTVLASFVQGEGDLDKLNKTCDEDETFSWTTPSLYQDIYLSTDNAYDGVYDPSLSAKLSGSSSEVYRASSGEL